MTKISLNTLTLYHISKIKSNVHDAFSCNSFKNSSFGYGSWNYISFNNENIARRDFFNVFLIYCIKIQYIWISICLCIHHRFQNLHKKTSSILLFASRILINANTVSIVHRGVFIYRSIVSNAFDSASSPTWGTMNVFFYVQVQRRCSLLQLQYTTIVNIFYIINSFSISHFSKRVIYTT